MVARALKRPGGRVLLAEEGGFTLLEAMIASTLALLLLGVTVTLFVTSQRNATSLIVKANAVQIANAGLRAMDQDLRQAYQVEYPTSTLYNAPAGTGCTAVSAGGIQPCNQIDVLVRPGSGSDYEVRYDCSVASTTIPADHACWRYLCSASAATPAGSTCTSLTSGVAARLVIDDLVNGTVADPVFSFCYASSNATGAACTSGATRFTSGTVTIKTPAAGTLSAGSGGAKSTVILTNGVYLPNLDYGQ